MPVPMITDEDLKGTQKTVLFGKEKKIEQVPTNWEELKELCKEKDISEDDDKIQIKLNYNDYLYLHKSGHIYCMDEDSNISIGYDRTPQQMWQIIKNLIGEE